MRRRTSQAVVRHPSTDHAALPQSLNAFSKWKPEEGLTVQAFVSNLVGNGGYVLAEATDPKVIVAFVSKYNFWNDVNVVPVVEVGELVPIGAASLAWARRSKS